MVVSLLCHSSVFESVGSQMFVHEEGQPGMRGDDLVSAGTWDRDTVCVVHVFESLRGVVYTPPKWTTVECLIL